VRAQPYKFGKIKQQAHAAYEKATLMRTHQHKVLVQPISIVSPRSPFVGPGYSNYLSFTQS